MKNMKYHLKKYNWGKGNLFHRVVKLKDSLKEIQKKLDDDVHNKELKNKAIEVLKEYNAAVIDEEKYLYQIAKVEWLNKGEKNSAYFHPVVKGMRYRNHVDSICDENVNQEEMDRIYREVSKAEIKYALKSINDNKAPGPDGYTRKNFKKAWSVVGVNVCTTLKEFFQSSKMLVNIEHMVKVSEKPHILELKR
ncbi:hypothetical protein Tco_0290311 [Tanacetum coccineum]